MVRQSPTKNLKWGFFCLNMKFSMCIDYTRKIPKIPPWERGEREGSRLPTFQTISKKSLYHCALENEKT